MFKYSTCDQVFRSKYLISGQELTHSKKFSTFFRTLKKPSLKVFCHLVRDPVVQPVNLHPPL